MGGCGLAAKESLAFNLSFGAILTRMEEPNDEHVGGANNVTDHISVAAKLHRLLPPTAFGLLPQLRKILKKVER